MKEPMMHNDLHEACGQCGFAYARIDTECWGDRGARRVMCPICGWTKYEEYSLEPGSTAIIKGSVKRGFGAYRLIPPGGFSGYNAFHEQPSPEVVKHIQLLLERGWKGYLTIWDEERDKARLVAGHPLQRYEIPDEEGSVQ